MNKLTKVEQIHADFNTATMRVVPANESLSSYNARIKKMIKLGFTNSQEVREARDAGIFAQEYFASKYHYKMISWLMVLNLCRKYELYCEPVNKFIGNIPAKNMQEIINFRIAAIDECYLYKTAVGQQRYTNSSQPVGIGDRLEKDCMYICAPGHMFSDKIQPNFDDPIVLQPVYYSGDRYFLIVTAWGGESQDPNVFNIRNN
jgi:hypothetical protein